MLSKSQARLFFILGTLLFSFVFLWLTVDTIKAVPKQTHSENITEEVVRGKNIWDKNNCMGCHTLLGEGAYYAPELTKVYERRGKDWMKVFLKDPQAMFPGERKMVQYNFKDNEIDDVIAFFKWIGEMDLNGFPAKPNLKVSGAPVVANVPTVTAMPEKVKSLCTACHSIGGNGGNVGPALDGVGKKFDATYFKKWIQNPNEVKPGTTMPKLPLTEQEIDEIVVFLTTLK